MSEEKYGFRIGQKVRLVSGGGKSPLYGFKNGNEYTVIGFDTNGDVNDCVCIKSGGNQGHARKCQIQPIPTRTTVTGPATITLAAGETIAFEGNATVKQDWVPKFGDRVTFVDPPKDMVGEFGVVTDLDYPDEYGVTYDDGSGSNRVWLALENIKPYEAE